MSTLAATRPARKPRQTKTPHGTASLTLTVNGTAYRVHPIRPDKDFGVVRAFRLTKADGVTYDVAQSINGIECSCPDWIFNRDGIDAGGCKHIKSCVAVGILD